MRPHAFALALVSALLAATGCDSLEKRIARYEAPERAEWQKPDEVVRALALDPDATVVDLGAGSGYFSVRLARAVPRGTVHALEIDEDLVDYIAKRAEREGLTNLRARVVEPGDADLEPGAADLVLLVDVYHHISDRSRYLAGLAPGLAPGGRVAIVDFHREAKRGPPPEERVSAERLVEEARAAGFTPVREHTFLPEQYFIELGR